MPFPWELLPRKTISRDCHSYVLKFLYIGACYFRECVLSVHNYRILIPTKLVYLISAEISQFTVMLWSNLDHVDRSGGAWSFIISRHFRFQLLRIKYVALHCCIVDMMPVPVNSDLVTITLLKLCLSFRWNGLWHEFLNYFYYSSVCSDWTNLLYALLWSHSIFFKEFLSR